jgi:hypothetical protein
MQTHRFGRKIRLPSTLAIKVAIMRLMLQEEREASASALRSDESAAAYAAQT